VPVLLGKRVDVRAVFDAEDRRIEVTWQEEGEGEGTPPALTSKDWIGLFRVGTKSNKKWLTYQYVGSAKELIFAVPKAAQTQAFELRYFRAVSSSASGNVYSGKSAPIEVPNTDLLTILPTSKATNIRVRWSCTSQEASASDWIGLHDATIPDNSKYVLSKYTSKGTLTSEDKDSGVVEFDLTGVKPGAYELRYFSAAVGKYTPLMRCPLSVPPPVSTLVDSQ
jgi:hypothetical protein